MTTERMNIHKALIELKTLDSRIRNAVMGTTFVMANKHSNTKINGVSIKEYTDSVQESFQKAKDLISRRNSIKRAVVMSNATTMVSIGGSEYTVAEAIEMKNHGIEFYRLMQSQLVNNCHVAETECNRNNGDTLDRKADIYVNNLYGNTDMKTASEEIKKVREDFIKSQTYELIDPIGVKEAIEKYDDFIKNFEVEVDSELSRSNALTEIEVTY